MAAAVTRKHRVLVVGPVPPPYAGQHLMVQLAVDRLGADERFNVSHLEWRFAESFESLQQASVRKVVEIARTVGRLVKLRGRHRFDAALFPIGSPSVSSTVRDVLLLPFVLLSSRRTVLHFHGAGHEASWSDDVPWWARVARALYRRAGHALVMTPFNAVDPRWLGIDDIDVLSHRLPDDFDEALLRRPRDEPWTALYVGHLGPQRSTPALLEAFARLRDVEPGARLHLVGRPSYGYSTAEMQASIERLGLTGAVVHDEQLVGRAKWTAFGEASCFVFPSVYECESFGLVLAEALMWGLPVVLTDWRGATEVVPARCDRVVVPVHDGMASADDLAAALLAALDRRDRVGFSERNRAAFLELYASFDAWPIGDLLVGRSTS